MVGVYVFLVLPAAISRLRSWQTLYLRIRISGTYFVGMFVLPAATSGHVLQQKKKLNEYTTYRDLCRYVIKKTKIESFLCQ